MSLKNLAVVISVLMFTGCYEKTTSNPIEAYKLWSGESPPVDITVINGNYWQSSHWTKEYILYLEVKAPHTWIEQFLIQDHLIKDTLNTQLPNDVPNWFKPPKTSTIWIPAESNQGAICFYDSLTNRLFIYDIQL